MGIDFSRQRWERVKESHTRFWAGDLKRPIIQLRGEREPDRPRPKYYGRMVDHLVYDLSVPVAEVIDLADYNLSCRRFLGDAFPDFYPNFGPGVIAAFMGARAENAESTTWFTPEEEADIRNIRFEYDPDNVWWRRIKEIYKAAMERWEGMVQLGTTDLGGNMDIVSTFRPGEKLLLDLYDNPEEVKRLVWDAHRMWWRYFDEINGMLAGVNPGYTGWCPVFSVEPWYVLQCDFCYMISTGMFDEFVKPELAASAKRLTNSIYHLDGVGALPHLDSLLSIPELGGIQWVYGDGKPGAIHWPEVYKKIADAGKRIHLYCSVPDFDAIAQGLGRADLIVYSSGNMGPNGCSDAEAMELLAKYKAL